MRFAMDRPVPQNYYVKRRYININYTYYTSKFFRGGVKLKHILQVEGNVMRIVLDTDMKTITLPWNYMDKLRYINQMI